MVLIEIDGPPIPWKRPVPHVIKKNGSYRAVMYDSQKKEKEMIRWQIGFQFKEERIKGPVKLMITFRFPVPKSASKKIREQMLNGQIRHMVKPDGDNLSKLYFDAMNELVFADDAQICDFRARKVYSSFPSTCIQIETYEFCKEQDDANQMQELENDEYNNRISRWGEDRRDSFDKERIIAIRGENPVDETV